VINWRSGKAGFVGSSKRLIKGVFEFIYTAPTDLVVIQDIVDGILSKISPNGFGVTSTISMDGDGILSTMQNSGIISTMAADGFGVTSAMTSNGDGIISTL